MLCSTLYAIRYRLSYIRKALQIIFWRIKENARRYEAFPLENPRPASIGVRELPFCNGK